jgi:quinolinate synthase
MPLKIAKYMASIEKPRLPLASCRVNQDTDMLFDKALSLIKEKRFLLAAHYYTDINIQRLAEEAGGIIADSLAMAKFCTEHPAERIVVAGVYFMGETVKILNPSKMVFMPNLTATCSLDVGCPSGKFSKFCEDYSDRTVVAYINTSAAVKAQADWIVTSRIAIDVVKHLSISGKKILWAPDKHMANYIEQETNADIISWDGACIVHDAFKTDALEKLKLIYPDAGVLAHPESPAPILEMADFIGSTNEIISAATNLDYDTFIVATDRGIFYKLYSVAPSKNFIEAPNGGAGATCKSCAHCPWMEMNQLDSLVQVLEEENNEILVEPSLIEKARLPLQRMLDFPF